jgi:hypothetical protein
VSRFRKSLDAHGFTETVRFKLTAGFVVDELLDPAKSEVPFGSYVSTYEIQEDYLALTRRLALLAATITVEQYGVLQGFFDRVSADEQTPVVLVKE